MKNIVVSKTRKSREYISNPHSCNDLGDRLKKSNCVHYGDIIEIRDLGNGYSCIESIGRRKK